MYRLENIHTKEVYVCEHRYEAARKADISPSYIEVLIRSTKVTKQGWKVEKLK